MAQKQVAFMLALFVVDLDCIASIHPFSYGNIYGDWSYTAWGIKGVRTSLHSRSKYKGSLQSVNSNGFGFGK